MNVVGNVRQDVGVHASDIRTLAVDEWKDELRATSVHDVPN